MQSRTHTHTHFSSNLNPDNLHAAGEYLVLLHGEGSQLVIESNPPQQTTQQIEEAICYLANPFRTFTAINQDLKTRKENVQWYQNSSEG